MTREAAFSDDMIPTIMDKSSGWILEMIVLAKRRVVSLLMGILSCSVLLQNKLFSIEILARVLSHSIIDIAL